MRFSSSMLRPSLNWLLVFVPLSLAFELAHQSLLIFITSGLAIVPLAGLIGRATDQLAIRVAATLMLLYVAALIFMQYTHEHLFRTPESDEQPDWSRSLAIGVLLGAALLVGLESELLVSALDPALKTLGLSPLFVGLILIPIIGNAAEHSSAVFFAIRNKLDVTLEIAVGSSTQVALFVAPAVVFISLALGRPMDFIFTGFEIGAVAIATVVLAVISLDGRSNWLEGLQLISVFTIIALAAFFL